MATPYERQIAYRDRLRHRGLTARGRPWKRLPPHLAEQHAADLRLVVESVPRWEIVADMLLEIADDLDRHAGKVQP